MRSARLVLLCLSLLGLAAAASAEDYYLPQVANGSYAEGSFRTTFVFFNTQNTPVTATLTLTNDQGGPLTLTIPGLGTGAQFQMTLPAGATRIVQTDGSGTLVAGAARVSTTADIGVSALFTVSDTRGSFQTEAGVGSSQGLTDFVIPVDVTGTFNTGVALYDVGGSGANATLRLINLSGIEVDQTPVTLQPGGHTARFVTQLFPNTSSNFQGTLRVTSTRPISAAGLRQNSPPLSYTSLPAVSSTAGSTEFNLPQVANGSFAEGSFRTSFLIFNLSGSIANATLSLTGDNGAPFPVTIPGQGTKSTFDLQLAPGGSTFLQTNGSGNLQAGAARITSNVPIGAAAIFTVFDSQSRFQTEAGVGGSTPLTELTLPVDVSETFNTGVGFFVPGTTQVTVNMRLLNEAGNVTATAQPLLLQPKNHTARFVTQLFPNVTEFKGSLAVSASGPIAALTLRQHSGPLSYTTLPVVEGISQGTQPQAAPLLSQTRSGIGATTDSTINQTLPGGFRLSGTISGAPMPTDVVARSGANVFEGAVDALTRRYLVIVPAGTYQLTVCCSQALTDPFNSLKFTYTEPGTVQVSGDTQHNIAVPGLALFDVSGTVTGLPTLLPSSNADVVFTSTDKSVEGSFALQAGGSFSGQLPNGSYVASVQILDIGVTGFQSTSIYNIGALNVNNGAATANFTAPATARLSGNITQAGASLSAEGTLFFAQDRSAGIPQEAVCVTPPVGSFAFVGPGGAYESRLVTNRTHAIMVLVPVTRGATTDVVGGVFYPGSGRQLALGADATSDFNVPAFPAQVRITGKVTDSTGRGVPDVGVSATSTEVTGAADVTYIGSAETDSAGNYELVLLSGINYEIVFTPPTPKP